MYKGNSEIAGYVAHELMSPAYLNEMVEYLHATVQETERTATSGNEIRWSIP